MDTEHTSDGLMIIPHTESIKTITNKKNGRTAVLVHGQVLEMWPNMPVNRFIQKLENIKNKTFTKVQLN